MYSTFAFSFILFFFFFVKHWKYLTSGRLLFKILLLTVTLYFYSEYKRELFSPWLSPSRHFSDVCLTGQSSAWLAGGPWAIKSQMQSDSKEMKGGGLRQFKHTTLSAHSTSRAHIACLYVSADLSKSHMCICMHAPDLFCWHCSLTPEYGGRLLYGKLSNLEQKYVVVKKTSFQWLFQI